MQKILALLLLPALTAPAAPAGTCWVAPGGDDGHPGTKDKPFRTIQKAADTVRPGDTCRIRGGTYRAAVVLKTAGRPGKPILFAAADGERVVLDGTRPVTGAWTRQKDGIWAVPVDDPVEQLFAGETMMVEARWPDMDFPDRLFDRATWASAAKGSRYGTIRDPQLAGTGIDWTGAHITLNVAHQFFTWTRTVTGHGAGKDTLTYPKDLKGITHYAKHEKGWQDDYYFLSGTRAALDRPTEWYYDADKNRLYFSPPGGKDPSTLDVRYRVRQHAVTGKNLHHVHLRGLRFFACSFRFTGCSDLVVDGCRLRYPTYSRHVRNPKYRTCRTALSGDRNCVRNCVIARASHGGLRVGGNENVVEDCLIRDVCWHGSLGYAGLNISGEANVTRHNTIYNGGNALLQCPGGNQRVAYNHVRDGGLLCRDVALVYTQLPRCRGTVIHHNWVHGCMTEGYAGHDRVGGMGIRGDDQTRGLTVHHNVVWDCGIHGIIVKGDENRVFNNTVFDVGPRDPAKRNDNNSRHLLIPTRAEPKKPWRKQHPLLAVQNAHSLFCNNAVGNIVWRKKPLPPGDRVSHNRRLGGKPIGNWLVDPDNHDFRPKKGSPLIDAGRPVPGFAVDYAGTAPDIGAYEYGKEPWKPGIRWDPEEGE